MKYRSFAVLIVVAMQHLCYCADINYLEITNRNTNFTYPYSSLTFNDRAALVNSVLRTIQASRIINGVVIGVANADGEGEAIEIGALLVQGIEGITPVYPISIKGIGKHVVSKERSKEIVDMLIPMRSMELAGINRELINDVTKRAKSDGQKAQQVDSAEPSTNAVPLSMPSGSAR